MDDGCLNTCPGSLRGARTAGEAGGDNYISGEGESLGEEGKASRDERLG